MGVNKELMALLTGPRLPAFDTVLKVNYNTLETGKLNIITTNCGTIMCLFLPGSPSHNDEVWFAIAYHCCWANLWVGICGSTPPYVGNVGCSDNFTNYATFAYGFKAGSMKFNGTQNRWLVMTSTNY